MDRGDIASTLIFGFLGHARLQLISRADETRLNVASSSVAHIMSPAVGGQEANCTTTEMQEK
jgi:hypothetical protein